MTDRLQSDGAPRPRPSERPPGRRRREVAALLRAAGAERERSRLAERKKALAALARREQGAASGLWDGLAARGLPRPRLTFEESELKMRRLLGVLVLRELAAAGLVVTLRDGVPYRAGGDAAAQERAERFRAEILLALRLQETRRADLA